MVEKILNLIVSFFIETKYKYTRLRIRLRMSGKERNAPEEQPIDIYWDPDFLKSVNSWGEGTAWNEILYFLINCHGKVIDVACGPGHVMNIIQKRLNHIDLYGFDISEFLIEEAIKVGIHREKLFIADATDTKFRENEFDYSYSMGSLEHFTEEGICQFLEECHKYTRYISFHQIPTSRFGKDEGWVTSGQSYFNNSVEWWLKRFNSVYEEVEVFDSKWEDGSSLGKWFVCIKNRPITTLPK